MMIIKMFIQPTCSKCPSAKQIIRKVEDKVAVEYFDIKTADGLAEALEYDIMTTPSIIILDNNGLICRTWKSETPSIEEINKYIL